MEFKAAVEIADGSAQKHKEEEWQDTNTSVKE